MFDVIMERIKAFADNIAIVSDGKEYTYQMLEQEVLRQIEIIDAFNVGKEDVVVLIGDFSLESIASLIALLLSKSTVIPLTEDAYSKLEKYVQKLEPDYIFNSYSKEFIPVQRREIDNNSENWRSIIPQDGGLIVFTSGSTGVPKAIVHDINSLCYRYISPRKPLCSICFLLFDHMGGINTILFLLFRGGTAVNIKERRVDVICQAIENYKVQLLPTTPSFLSQLLIANAHQKYDLSSLSVISYGTEVMSESVLKKLNEVMPHCRFKQTYGLSETGVFQIESRSNDSLWFKINDNGVKTKIIDNVLWIKTKSNLLGKVLFNTGAAELEKEKNEWFCTNDLVEVDGDYIKILGRQTEIINVAGLKVYPSEVENCIQELDFVADVIVIGKKHLMLGQIVVANIVLIDGVCKEDAKGKIKSHCLSRLEKFKVPSKISFQVDNFINDRFKKVRI